VVFEVFGFVGTAAQMRRGNLDLPVNLQTEFAIDKGRFLLKDAS
jgi:hypothetical protein